MVGMDLVEKPIVEKILSLYTAHTKDPKKPKHGEHVVGTGPDVNSLFQIHIWFSVMVFILETTDIYVVF